MIIDTRARLWLAAEQLGGEVAGRLRRGEIERWRLLDASTTALENSSRCVDVTLIHSFRSQLLGAHVPAACVADFVARDPGSRLLVASVDPMADDPIGQFEQAIALGACGISVSPACQGFHPCHSMALALYERCAARCMPIFISGTTPLTASASIEFASPLLWDEVARTFPSLPLVFAEVGSPWIEQTLVLLAKHEQVWADVGGLAVRTWPLYAALQSAQAMGVMSKLFFASGFPFDNAETVIEALYRVNAMCHTTPLPTIPRSQIQAIVERDALACLSIDIAGAAKTTVPPRTSARRSSAVRPWG